MNSESYKVQDETPPVSEDLNLDFQNTILGLGNLKNWEELEPSLKNRFLLTIIVRLKDLGEKELQTESAKNYLVYLIRTLIKLEVFRPYYFYDYDSGKFRDVENSVLKEKIIEHLNSYRKYELGYNKSKLGRNLQRLKTEFLPKRAKPIRKAAFAAGTLRTAQSIVSPAPQEDAMHDIIYQEQQQQETDLASLIYKFNASSNKFVKDSAGVDFSIESLELEFFDDYDFHFLYIDDEAYVVINGEVLKCQIDDNSGSIVVEYNGVEFVIGILEANVVDLVSTPSGDVEGILSLLTFVNENKSLEYTDFLRNVQEDSGKWRRYSGIEMTSTDPLNSELDAFEAFFNVETSQIFFFHENKFIGVGIVNDRGDIFVLDENGNLLLIGVMSAQQIDIVYQDVLRQFLDASEDQENHEESSGPDLLLDGILIGGGVLSLLAIRHLWKKRKLSKEERKEIEDELSRLGITIEYPKDNEVGKFKGLRDPKETIVISSEKGFPVSYSGVTHQATKVEIPVGWSHIYITEINTNERLPVYLFAPTENLSTAEDISYRVPEFIHPNSLGDLDTLVDYLGSRISPYYLNLNDGTKIGCEVAAGDGTGLNRTFQVNSFCSRTKTFFYGELHENTIDKKGYIVFDSANGSYRFYATEPLNILEDEALSTIDLETKIHKNTTSADAYFKPNLDTKEEILWSEFNAPLYLAGRIPDVHNNGLNFLLPQAVDVSIDEANEVSEVYLDEFSDIGFAVRNGKDLSPGERASLGNFEESNKIVDINYIELEVGGTKKLVPIAYKQSDRIGWSYLISLNGEFGFLRPYNQYWDDLDGTISLLTPAFETCDIQALCDSRLEFTSYEKQVELRQRSFDEQLDQQLAELNQEGGSSLTAEQIPLQKALDLLGLTEKQIKKFSIEQAFGWDGFAYSMNIDLKQLASYVINDENTYEYTNIIIEFNDVNEFQLNLSTNRWDASQKFTRGDRQFESDGLTIDASKSPVDLFLRNARWTEQSIAGQHECYCDRITLTEEGKINLGGELSVFVPQRIANRVKTTTSQDAFNEAQRLANPLENVSLRIDKVYKGSSRYSATLSATQVNFGEQQIEIELSETGSYRINDQEYIDPTAIILDYDGRVREVHSDQDRITKFDEQGQVINPSLVKMDGEIYPNIIKPVETETEPPVVPPSEPMGPPSPDDAGPSDWENIPDTIKKAKKFLDILLNLEDEAAQMAMIENLVRSMFLTTDAFRENQEFINLLSTSNLFLNIFIEGISNLLNSSEVEEPQKLVLVENSASVLEHYWEGRAFHKPLGEHIISFWRIKWNCNSNLKIDERTVKIHECIKIFLQYYYFTSPLIRRNYLSTQSVNEVNILSNIGLVKDYPFPSNDVVYQEVTFAIDGQEYLFYTPNLEELNSVINIDGKKYTVAYNVSSRKLEFFLRESILPQFDCSIETLRPVKKIMPPGFDIYGRYDPNTCDIERTLTLNNQQQTIPQIISKNEGSSFGTEFLEDTSPKDISILERRGEKVGHGATGEVYLLKDSSNVIKVAKDEQNLLIEFLAIDTLRKSGLGGSLLEVQYIPALFDSNGVKIQNEALIMPYLGERSEYRPLNQYMKDNNLQEFYLTETESDNLEVLNVEDSRKVFNTLNQVLDFYIEVLKSPMLDIDRKTDAQYVDSTGKPLFIDWSVMASIYDHFATSRKLMNTFLEFIRGGIVPDVDIIKIISELYEFLTVRLNPSIHEELDNMFKQVAMRISLIDLQDINFVGLNFTETIDRIEAFESSEFTKSREQSFKKSIESIRLVEDAPKTRTLSIEETRSLQFPAIPKYLGEIFGYDFEDLIKATPLPEGLALRFMDRFSTLDSQQKSAVINLFVEEIIGFGGELSTPFISEISNEGFIDLLTEELSRRFESADWIYSKLKLVGLAKNCNLDELADKQLESIRSEQVAILIRELDEYIDGYFSTEDIYRPNKKRLDYDFSILTEEDQKKVLEHLATKMNEVVTPFTNLEEYQDIQTLQTAHGSKEFRLKSSFNYYDLNIKLPDFLNLVVIENVNKFKTILNNNFARQSNRINNPIESSSDEPVTGQIDISQNTGSSTPHDNLELPSVTGEIQIDYADSTPASAQVLSTVPPGRVETKGSHQNIVPSEFFASIPKGLESTDEQISFTVGGVVCSGFEHEFNGESFWVSNSSTDYTLIYSLPYEEGNVPIFVKIDDQIYEGIREVQFPSESAESVKIYFADPKPTITRHFQEIEYVCEQVDSVYSSQYEFKIGLSTAYNQRHSLEEQFPSGFDTISFSKKNSSLWITYPNPIELVVANKDLTVIGIDNVYCFRYDKKCEITLGCSEARNMTILNAEGDRVLDTGTIKEVALYANTGVREVRFAQEGHQLTCESLDPSKEAFIVDYYKLFYSEDGKLEGCNNKRNPLQGQYAFEHTDDGKIIVTYRYDISQSSPTLVVTDINHMKFLGMSSNPIYLYGEPASEKGIPEQEDPVDLASQRKIIVESTISTLTQYVREYFDVDTSYNKPQVTFTYNFDLLTEEDRQQIITAFDTAVNEITTNLIDLGDTINMEELLSRFQERNLMIMVSFSKNYILIPPSLAIPINSTTEHLQNVLVKELTSRYKVIFANSMIGEAIFPTIEQISNIGEDNVNEAFKLSTEALHKLGSSYTMGSLRGKTLDIAAKKVSNDVHLEILINSSEVMAEQIQSLFDEVIKMAYLSDTTNQVEIVTAIIKEIRNVIRYYELEFRIDSIQNAGDQSDCRIKRYLSADLVSILESDLTPRNVNGFIQIWKLTTRQ